MNAHTPNPEISSDFALAVLRTAVSRVKLIENELVAVGLALKQGTISVRDAVRMVNEVAPGLFGVVAGSVGGLE
jgi:hypothetical protein